MINVKYIVNIFSDVSIRHGTSIEFSTKYSLSRANNLCYEVFGQNDIIETIAPYFFKKVRQLS